MQFIKINGTTKIYPKKLSKATIETPAIMVYHQPVTRSEIEKSGWAANARILLELDWVRPVTARC